MENPEQNPPGTIPGIIFTASNDGGKTGIYWRENIFEVLAYLEPHKDTLGDYCVVAVRKTVK